MLFHRYGTFLHILASTGLHCCSKQYEPVGVEDIVQTVKVDLLRLVTLYLSVDEMQVMTQS